MRNKTRVILGLICICAIIMFSWKQYFTPEQKANEYMKYMNQHRIKAGCFYIKNDSAVTYKNFMK